MKYILLFCFIATASAQQVPSVEQLYDAITGQPTHTHPGTCESCLEKKMVEVYGLCQKEKLDSCNGVECPSLHCKRLSSLEDRGTQLVFKNCKTAKLDECLKGATNVSTCNKLYCQFYSKTPSKFFNIAHCPKAEEVSVCQKNGGGNSCILNNCLFYSLSEYKDLKGNTNSNTGSFNISGFPYFTQYANYRNPGATCQNTSIAMVLNYLHPNKKLKPDDLTAKFGNNLGQTPEGVVQILRNYGVKADSTRIGRIETLKKQLSLGRPVIINGYFTKGGHVMVVTGYDKAKDEFIVNDPAGRWAGHYGGGYPNPGVNGKQAHYKASAFKQAVSPDGNIWMAVVSTNGEDVNI